METTAMTAPSMGGLEPVSLDEAMRLAKVLAGSSLLPTALRGKPADVLVSMLTGRELGLAPLQSTRMVHVIEGKPVLSADLMVALCKRASVCRYFRLVESTPEGATYETHREGEPEPTRLAWTAADARRAGLDRRPTWQAHPAAMLRARCSAALARAVYPDLVGGLYEHDEGEEIRRGGAQAWQAPPVPSTPAAPEETFEEAHFEPVTAPPTPPPDPEAPLLAAIDAARDEAVLQVLAPALARAKTPALVAAYRARREALRAAALAPGKPWPEQAPEEERYPDPEPEEPAETHYVADAPDPSRYTIPGGRSKGTPLPEASDRDLSYWGGRIGGDLDAGKTDERYRARDEELLAAIREEQRRRAGGEQPEPPAEEWPTTDEIPF